MNIKKNLILNTSYQLLNIIVPLITAPYLARTIGAEGVGTYAYYNSIAYYFILFIMLGLNNYGNRTIARAREKREDLNLAFSSIYSLQFGIGIFSIAIYIVYALFTSESYNLIACINIIYVLSGIFDINWFFSGLEKFKIVVFRNIIIKLLTLIAILSFVRCKQDLAIYVFIMAASAFISQIAIWPFVIKEVKWVKPQWKDIKKHIKPNLILFIPVIAVSLYKIMDKIMIGVLSSKVQVGFYENSEKIINIPQALINSLGVVMLPRITHLIAIGEENKSRQYTRDSMQYAMFMSIGAAFGLIGIAPNFTDWFFGPGFSQCRILIACLAPTIIFNAWANVIRTQYLIPLNKDKSYILSVSAGAVINLCLNVILIGKLEAFGAVIGTFAAEFAVMLIQTLYVYKEIEVGQYIKDNICFLVSGFCMCIILYWIGTFSINGLIKLIIQLCVGAAVYLVCSMVLALIIDRERCKYIIVKLIHK